MTATAHQHDDDPDDVTALFPAPVAAPRTSGAEDPGVGVSWADPGRRGQVRRGTIWSAGPMPGTWWAITDDNPRHQALIRRSFDGYARVANIPTDWPRLVADAVRWIEANIDRLCTVTLPDAWRIPTVHTDGCAPVLHAGPERYRQVPLSRMVASIQVPLHAPASWPQPRGRVVFCPYVLAESGLA